MWVEPIVLQDATIRLEPLRWDHMPGLLQVAHAPLIWRYTRLNLSSAEAMERWIAASLGQPDVERAFVVKELATGRIIGSSSYLAMMPEHRGLEIGRTWYHPDHWGTAVNPSCKLLLMTHAFERLGALRVQYVVNRLNERSRRAVERLGAQLEGILRQHVVLPDGSLRDSVYYSILDHEWPEVKARLLARVPQATPI